MELVLYPDERLKQECVKVEEITPELQQLARDMNKFMIEKKGIGLAANQVGENIRLIVVQHLDKPIYMFNPVLIQATKNQYKFEGCLSFPGETKKCRRAQLIVVRYTSINGKIKTKQFSGLTARCVQHEIDHLNGVTFDERERK